ncbi:hypothetical protein ACFYY8_36800 [Streptosporangium sp. NPDC001559]|uniref:hypothetical protein n=1 Tax=Streptosporangium sp. NPDC001559 TaxID=3366187 RepID=UPI0036EAC2F5
MASRLYAVLAVSGPVILTAFGIGTGDLPWFCSSESPYLPEGPYALESVPAEALFLGILLLPVVVAGLVSYGSRRTVLAAAFVTGAVLVLGLLVSVPDPCTGQVRTASFPWPLLVCYPVAVGALLLAARHPLSSGRYGFAPWAAVLPAAWGALCDRPVSEFDERSFTVFFVMAPESSDDVPRWLCAALQWFSQADRIGLPVALVALAAVAHATGLSRWIGATVAAVLLLFPVLDVFPVLDDLLLVRSHLLLAALLVVWTARPTRLKVRPGSLARVRTVAATAVVVLCALWLAVSSYVPPR